MSLEIKVNEQIKEAMKAKEEATLRTLRAIKSAIIIEKTSEGFSGAMTPESELKMLQKLAKQRRDSLSIFEQQNREDLAAKEREELAVIEKFLPAQMSADDLKAAIEALVMEVGANSPADMGKVMGVASKKLSSQADGKAISEMVKTILTSK
ncbi:MAG: GatB/YqeY domain-containing protein [Phycisphaerales bacterium]|nr:GatB/YqeY domain-containing protein [Phycisphaerales bacterium]